MRNYGTLELTITSPPQAFVEVLTLSQVKTYLNLPERSPADAGEDAMIEGFIAGAREQAEILQGGKDLVPKQYDLSLDAFPFEVLMRKPLISVDLAKYKDSDGVEHTITEGTDFIVDLKRALARPLFAQSWPIFVQWPSSAVLFRFTSGYSATDAFWADAGARIKIGMLELISHWFSGRLPFELGSGQISEYPFTVTALLSSGANPRAW